ncbi:hypothetical protein HY772_08960, partial [Candidatus Woesearchaeota archaeon]|nr:hypothetical protein [Candidatus Woesearchaeota archaeon]
MMVNLDSEKMRITNHGTAGQNRFTIDTLGNVGMGNVSLASYKLNVAGQINASAGLCMNGDCRASWPQEVVGLFIKGSDAAGA